MSGMKISATASEAKETTEAKEAALKPRPEMTDVEIRVARVLIECMTEGLDQVSKRKSWERAIFGKEIESEARSITEWKRPLEVMEIPESEFHSIINQACLNAFAYQPTADYPEYNSDAAFVESQDFESSLSTQELMVRAQKTAIAHLKVLHSNFELRFRLAQRCNIKLIRNA
jgi:hypothetical protein